MNENCTQRFSGAVWFEMLKSQHANIVGLGGIGSWTSFAIGKLGVKSINLIDHDVVSPENMAGQMHFDSLIGQSKVVSMRRVLDAFRTISLVGCYRERVTRNKVFSGHVISCLDNMESRREVYEAWKRNVDSKSKSVFIDGRLSAEMYQIICMESSEEENMKRYEEQYLFSDAEAEEQICSYKQTTFMAMQIGGMIANVFVNKLCQVYMQSERYVPFFMEYHGPLMTTKFIE